MNANNPIGAFASRKAPPVWLTIFSACLLAGFSGQAAQYATSVVDYTPGNLPASVASFTNTSAVLGEPARSTPGPFGGPVDQFNPPYLNTQVVSLGENGGLTVSFNPPIVANPVHPFGLDFIIFGNAGFNITNGNYSGGGITDGALFGNNPGTARVLVSADNAHYYALSSNTPSLVDARFPTDGMGDFGRPVDPQLADADFAGKDLEGIRALYQGSGGGAGFSLAGAVDSQGQPVHLLEVSYVRVEVMSGHAEIDGLAAVDPSVALAEDFEANPLDRGWRTRGDTSLFAWNATNQNLEVTWDSGHSNSFFYYPLNRVLSKRDAFHLQFDLRLQDIAAGVRPDRPFAFEVAVGFVNHLQAFDPAFERGTATRSPNLVEFDYFPDTGFGATVSPVIVSTNGQFIPSFTFPLPITPGEVFRIGLDYSPQTQTLNTVMFRNGAPVGPITPVVLGTNFTDFRVDTLAISSYSDTGADGSILAHGAIDNLRLTLPELPIRALVAQLKQGTWTVNFQGAPEWSYSLERSADLATWTSIARSTSPATNVELSDPAPPAARAFYRVSAELR